MGFLGSLLGVTNPAGSDAAVGQLEAQAAGRGPDPIGAAYRKRAEEIGSQEMGLMRGARGISPGTAIRQAGNLGAEALRDASAGAAMMQQQQMLMAQRQLAEMEAARQRQNTGIEAGMVGGLASGLGGVVAGPLGAWLAGKGASAVYPGDNATGGDWYMQKAKPQFAEGGPVAAPLPPDRLPEPPLPDVVPPWYEGETAKAEHAEAQAREAGPQTAPVQKAAGGVVPLYDYLGLTKPAHLARGGQTFMSDGTVPGQARVAGDSEQNDVVDAKLSPGEIVIPRSIAQSPNAPEEAAAFVAHLMQRNGSGYEKVAKAKGKTKMADGGEAPAPKEGEAETSSGARRFITHLSKLLGVKESGVVEKRRKLYEDVDKQTSEPEKKPKDE